MSSSSVFFAHLVYGYRNQSNAYAVHHVNLGDYIQTIAADAFLPRVDMEIDRDSVSSGVPEKTFLIANGWYCLHDQMHCFHPHLRPILVSMHVSPQSLGNPHAQVLFRLNELADKYPIGCRDYQTLEFFHNRGIPSYFSGCLTLTMQRERLTQKTERHGIVISDCSWAQPKRLIPSLPINRWFRQFCDVGEVREYLKQWIEPFENDVSVVTHVAKLGTSHKERFRLAMALLRTYAQAKLVITSRLHCALPCLAMGTPVVLVSPNDESRFGGLARFVNHIFIRNGRMMECKIGTNQAGDVVNPSDYFPYAQSLREACQQFIQEGL